MEQLKKSGYQTFVQYYDTIKSYTQDSIVLLFISYIIYKIFVTYSYT